MAILRHSKTFLSLHPAIGYGGKVVNCPDCLASLRDGASFCERCGAQINPYAVRPQQVQGRGNKRTVWIVVTVVAVVVAIQVVPSVILYFMVQDFADGSPSQTPVATLSRTTVAGGEKFTFVYVSSAISWSDVSLMLTEGVNWATWNPQSEIPTGTTGGYLGMKMLGTIGVELDIADLEGNGRIEGGDYLTLTAFTGSFSSTIEYILSVAYDPTGEVMCTASFTG